MIYTTSIRYNTHAVHVHSVTGLDYYGQRWDGYSII